MPTNLPQQLGKALQSIDKTYADMIAAPMTEITVYAAPFLQRYQIYRVKHFIPTHLVLFYVGYAEKQRAFLLTGAPDNYTRLAKADGVVIDAPEKAAQYAVAYLEVTRSMSKLFYLVSSVDQVKFRPGLGETDSTAREAFIEQYRPLIAPPAARLVGQNYQVTVYAIREQALERHTLEVSQEGDLKDEIAIVAQDLPLVYGL